MESPLTHCPACHHPYSKRARSCPMCKGEPAEVCKICQKIIPKDSESCPLCGDPTPYVEYMSVKEFFEILQNEKNASESLDGSDES